MPRRKTSPKGDAKAGDAKGGAKAEGGTAVRLMVDWGASGCAAAVARFDEGQWRLPLTP